MEKKLFYPKNSLRLCIDKMQGDITGRIYSVAGKQPIPFTGFPVFFLLGEELFDILETPQAFQEKRSFKKKERLIDKDSLLPWNQISEIYEQKGQWATYDVIVNTRKRSSWQGILKDASGKVLKQFESDLELLFELEKNNPIV